MANKKDLQFAKELAKHKGKLVALKDTRIVAVGDNVEEVQKSAEEKKVKGYALHLVPTHPLAMAV